MNFISDNWMWCLDAYIFSISGKTPLGQDIPNCKTNGGQNGPQSSPSIEAPGRSGSHCCCSPEQFGFCPNPRDYDGGFVCFHMNLEEIFVIIIFLNHL